MAGFGDLIKGGTDALKKIEEARKLKEKAEKEGGKIGGDDKPATEGFKVVPGEASPLAANVEKYMQENKIAVKANGTLSIAEAGDFKEHIQKLEKKNPALKGQITFAENGDIIFTEKALKMLEIDVPAKAPDKSSKISGGEHVAEATPPNVPNAGGSRQLG